MENNILTIIDDNYFQLADMNLSNKVFANRFDKIKYKKIRDKFILSLVEEESLKKQTTQFKYMFENKKKELEKRIEKTRQYKARLVELEIKNTTLFEEEVTQNINMRKNYACQLRDNKCSICHALIYGKPSKITKLAGKKSIGDWVYDRQKPNIGCKLDCGHIYHSHCITNWFLQKNQCPMCRAKVNLWGDRLPNIRSARPSQPPNITEPIFTITENTDEELSDNYSDRSDVSDISLIFQEEEQKESEQQPIQQLQPIAVASSRPSESQPAPLRPIRITSETTYNSIQQGIDEAERWQHENRESQNLFPLPGQVQNIEEEHIQEEESIFNEDISLQQNHQEQENDSLGSIFDDDL